MLEAFLWGVFGGVLVELGGFFELRKIGTAEFPDWIKSKHYRIITGLMVIAGGILVVVYVKSEIMSSPVQPLLAINIGASAPFIIRQLTSPPHLGKTD